MRRTVTLLCVLCVGWVLVGCSSGGGASSPVPEVAPKTGTVAIFLADGPAEEHEEINVTITEVSLIPAGSSGDDDDGDGPVVLFRSGVGKTVNILDLHREDFLLTVDDSVPEGVYSKIRLQISNTEAVGGALRRARREAPERQDRLEPSRRL